MSELQKRVEDLKRLHSIAKKLGADNTHILKLYLESAEKKLNTYKEG